MPSRRHCQAGADGQRAENLARRFFQRRIATHRAQGADFVAGFEAN